MNARRSLATAVVVVWMSQASLGGEPGLSTQFSACMDGSGGITATTLDCIGAEAKSQDQRLNKVYKEVMAELPAARKRQLQEAQRAWIKYRDANCDFYADPDGGTMATVIASDCVRLATTTRAEELEDLKEMIIVNR